MFRTRWIQAIALVCCIVFFPGCLALITTITSPADVTVDEDFMMAIDGSVIGKDAGTVALVVQVPESFQFRSASYLCSLGMRSLRRNPVVCRNFKAEPGYTLIGLSDSIPYTSITSDDFRVFTKFKPTETGSFTIKFAACAGEPIPDETANDESNGPQYYWKTTDPQKINDFAKVEGLRYTTNISVNDPERNGTAAINFTGSREYVALPDSGVLTFTMQQSFTLETWISTTALDSPFLSTRPDDFLSAFPIEVGINEFGAPVVLASDGRTLFQTKSAAFIADGHWHHLAVSYTADSLLYQVFIDGKISDRLFISQGVRNSSHASPILGGQGAKRKFFKGTFDEFRVWNVARTMEELNYYKNSAMTGYEQNLFALYSFDKGTSSRIPNLTRTENLDAIPFNRPKLVPSTAPLRVELLSFNVGQQGKEITMAWETFDESKVQGYEIEKRTEAGKYVILKSVTPQRNAGNHQIYNYTDTWSEKIVCYYRLRKINIDGSMLFSDEIPIGADLVLNFSLGDNQPNPFNGKTEIPYTLNEATYVSLTVYDLMGREIQELVSEREAAGEYRKAFDAAELPTGMYFYKLRTPNGSQTKKMFYNK